MSRNLKEISPRKEALKLQQTVLDVWSLKEKYHLAAAVSHSGNGNWTSVSRLVRQSFEKHKDERPDDWFSAKNCALQYSKLLEEIPAPERKKKRRLTANDASPSQRKADKSETHEGAIVKVLKEKRLQEALLQYDQMKAFLTKIENLNSMYHDPTISEKEKSEVSEAAKRIMAEAAEKKAARARWMVEREEKKKALQAQIDTLIKMPLIVPIKDAMNDLKDPKVNVTENKTDVPKSNETIKVEIVGGANSVVSNDVKEPNESNDIEDRKKIEAVEDQEDETKIENQPQEGPSCTNEQILSSDKQDVNDATLSIVSICNLKTVDALQDNPPENEKDSPVKVEVASKIDEEIEVSVASEIQEVKVENDEPESEHPLNLDLIESLTDTQVKRETVEDQKTEANMENGNLSEQTTRYIIPKLLKEISKYEKMAKRSESDNSRSSTPKLVTSNKSEELFESEDERREDAFVKRRSGRKSDATFGPTSDQEALKTFRKEALLILNNLHLQKSFTKLMPKQKDLKGTLHTEVKTLTGIRFDVESGVIRSMEELRWNVTHTLTAMSFSYKINQKEHREVQNLFKDFYSMTKKRSIPFDDSFPTSTSLVGLKQRRSSAMSDVDLKRKKK